MKNKSIDNNNEIDLIDLIKIIWDGKTKIILSIIITFILFYVYNLLQPKPDLKKNLYKNSLSISKSNNAEFYKFFPIYNYLNPEKYKLYSDQYNISTPAGGQIFKIDNAQILDNFVREILDYEELIYVLKNNKKIKEQLAQLPEKEQTDYLYKKYVKLFSVSKPIQASNYQPDSLKINLIWEDLDECKKILEQTINLTMINLQGSIFKGLDNMMEVKQNTILSEDLKKIAFLLEQSSIAKELNLENIQPNVGFNVQSNDLSLLNSYYLRGYKAIDKEINIIKNREYDELSNIKNKIDVLRKSNIEWINYNILFLESELIKSNKKKMTIPLGSSIVFGLIIGLFYVYISHAIRPTIVAKDKK